MTRNWSVAEAKENLPALLVAARKATQYIVDGDESFSVSVARPERSLEDLFDDDGPLRPTDLEDV